MNLVNTYIFTPPITYNTYIGGISASVSSASSLATKLGISVGAISNFTVVGSDIKCKITGSYAMPVNCWNSNSVITYFRDYDGLVTSIGAGGIDDYGQCYEWYFPNCLSIAKTNSNYSFHNNHTQGVVLYTPRCTDWGGTQGADGGMFLNIGNALDAKGFTIYAPIAQQTSNAGGVEGDLAAAIVGGYNTLKFVSNFTVPNPVTTLVAGTVYNTAIQLNFTAPSSTNTIEYYECWSNGVFKNKINASGGYITGLTASTSYDITVYAVDIFMNRSLVSNMVTQSTINYSYTDTDANAYTSARAITNPSSIEADYVLITQLKSNSLYTKIQSGYTFKGTTISTHKYNFKNPVDTDAGFRLVAGGSGNTYSELGYNGNGTGYLDSKFIPSANQTVNSNGITIVVGTNNTPAADVREVGSYVSNSQVSLIGVKINNTTYNRRSWINGTIIEQTGVNEARGVFTGVKTSSTVQKLFRNGSSIVTGNSAGTLPNISQWIGALNAGGSPYGYSNQRIQIILFHEGLSDAEASTLYSVIDLSEAIAGRKTW
ncbi:MAG: hypothetical protein H7Y10_03570 [Flavobacterium sp.]|nr:hypothetical protein [Flavobacterium sp.]